MKKTLLTAVISIAVLILMGTGIHALSQSITNATMRTKSEQILQDVLSESSNNKEKVSSETILGRMQNIDVNKDLKAILRGKGYYEDDVRIALTKFLNTSITYNMTDKESKYIMSLVNLDYDFERLVEIYDFLQRTNDNISYIKKIYDTATTMYEGFESKFWVENAYEQIKGTKEDSLTQDDIAYYTSQGISTDEILQAYEMSLQGIKPLKQMLKERLSGAKWRDIIKDIYVTKGFEPSVFDENISLRDLNTYILYAQKTGNLISDITDRKPEGVRIKQDIAQTFCDQNDDIRKAIESADVAVDSIVVLEEATRQLPSLDEKKIAELVQEGYRIKDVKKALSKDEKKLTSKDREVKQLIEQKGKEVQ